MKLDKTFYLKLMVLMMFLIHFHVASGQCNQQNIRATGYINGMCNGLQFQGIIGSMSSSYGECGNLFFDPPLSGTDITSSTNHSESDYLWEIYPNPSTGILNIETSYNRPYLIEIYSSIGKLMMSQKIENEGKQQLSLDDLLAGYYLLKLTVANENTKILKIIKI